MKTSFPPQTLQQAVTVLELLSPSPVFFENTIQGMFSMDAGRSARAFCSAFLPKEVPSPKHEHLDLLDKSSEDYAILQCLREFILSATTDQLGEAANEGKVIVGKGLRDAILSFVGLYTSKDSVQKVADELGHDGSRYLSDDDKHKIIWLPAQNAMMLVSQSSNEEEGTVAAWEVQSPGADAMGVSEVFARLPRVAVSVPWRVIESKSVRELIGELMTQQRSAAVAKAIKANEEWGENREAISATFVCGSFLACLGGCPISQRSSDVRSLQKKVRDQVTYEGGAVPWRRAAAWLAVKGAASVIALHGTESDSQEEALVECKQLVQGFLLHLLKAAAGSSLLSRSSVDHGLKKVFRRELKLEKATLASSGSPAVLHNGAVLKRWLTETVDKVRPERLEKPWEHRCSEVVITRIEHDPQTFHATAEAHKLPHSGDLLARLDAMTEKELENVECARVDQIHRESTCPHVTVVSLASEAAALFDEAMHEELVRAMAVRTTDPRSVVFGLFDTMHRVRHLWRNQTQFVQTLQNEPKARCLLTLSTTISQFGVQVFAGDCVNLSRVVLSALQIVMVVDAAACEVHPLLSDHQLGIPSKMLCHLLLEGKEEKEDLLALEKQIKKRDSKAKRGCIFEPYGPGCNNFGIKYARSSAEMRRCLNQRQADCAKLQNEKKKHREEQFKHYLRLLRPGEACRCSSHHQCSVCCDRGNAKYVFLQFHEKLLPNDEALQHAVIYEENIPHLLEIHRNVLIGLGELCGGKISSEIVEKGQWTSGRMVNLRSTHKSTKVTHYARGMHVKDHATFVCDNGLNTVLATHNEKDFQLLPVSAWAWSISELVRLQLSDISPYTALQQHFSTWKQNENEVNAIKSAADERLDLKEFESAGTLRSGHKLQLHRLAMAIEERALSFDHQDIATVVQRLLYQAGPPDDVDWRREAAHVVGSRPAFALDLCRLSNDLLEECKGSWKAHNTLLVVASIARMLLVHISASAHDAIRAAEKLILNARAVCKAWIADLMTKMQQSTSDSARQVYRQRVVDTAAMGVRSFVCVSGDSFSAMRSGELADWIYFQAVVNDFASPFELTRPSWRRNVFYAASMVVDEMARQELTGHTLHPSMQDALNSFLSEYWVGANRVSTSEVLSWTPGTVQSNGQTRLSGWWSTRCGNALVEVNVVGGDFLVDGLPCRSLPKTMTGHPVYQRFFGGALFLVQNVAGGMYKTAQKVNGRHFLFQTGDRIPGKNNDEPRIFEEFTHDNSQNPSKAILIPDTRFLPDSNKGLGDFPALLIEKYSHWYVYSSLENASAAGSQRCLLFRPRMYNEQGFSSPKFCYGDFVLTPDGSEGLRSRLLFEFTKGSKLERGRRVACLHSEPAQSVFANVLNRMALVENLHLFLTLDSDLNKIVEVELPLLQNLQLVLLPSRRLYSRELKMFVREKQDCGTFIGLKHGLLLEPITADGSDLQLLCPHGKTNKNSDGSVTIDLRAPGCESGLRRPPYFKYQIRSTLRDVHGPKERVGWLLLALLHLHTSDMLPDPLTGRTGLSRCFEIIQSGRCAGNLVHSIDKTSTTSMPAQFVVELQTLCDIAKVAPAREDYHGMEKNSLGMTVHEDFVAHDALPFVVHHRLLQIAEELALAGVESGEDMKALEDLAHELEKSGRLSLLARRSFLRFKESYPKDTLSRPENYNGEDNENEDDEEDITVRNGLQWNYDASRVSDGFALRPTVHEIQQLAAFARHGQAHPSAFTHGIEPIADLLGACTIETLVGVRDVERKCRVLSGHVSVFANSLRQEQGQHEFDEHCGEFSSYWLCLYEIARTINDEKKEAFVLVMALFMDKFHDEVHVKHLHQLLIVLRFRKQFPRAPSFQTYAWPSQTEYSSFEVEAVLEEHLKIFNEEFDSRNVRWWTQRRDQHDMNRRNAKKQLEMCARHCFDNKRDVSVTQLQHNLMTDESGAACQINNLLRRWHAAAELQAFANKVDATLQHIVASDIYSGNHVMCSVEALQQNSLSCVSRDFCRFEIDTGLWSRQHQCCEALMEVDGAISLQQQGANELNSTSFIDLSRFLERSPEYEECAQQLMNKLCRSWSLANTQQAASSVPLIDRESTAHLKARLEAYHQSAHERVERLTRVATSQLADKRLASVGLNDAISPFTVAQGYLSRIARDSTCHSPGMDRYCLALRELQRARRCLRLLQRQDAGRVYLEKELREWTAYASSPIESGVDMQRACHCLAFELDNDVVVRQEQTAVAEEMLSEAEGNRLLQLNMGDGKTSVIMPLVLCRAADGQRIVRGTVLSSLYAENVQDWQHKVGGMLGRRIYPMLCRRDLSLTEEAARWHLLRLERIRRGRHLVVTVPEHRLSLVNKVLELAAVRHTERSDTAISLRLWRLCEQLEERGRDFLDESDELLSPKFQLVYTLGAPADMDGGVLRWVTHFAAIRSVGYHAQEMQRAFGKESVDISESESRSFEFRGVRLLNGERSPELFEWLRKQIVDDILFVGESDVHFSLRPRLTQEEKDLFERTALNAHDPPSTAELEQLAPRDRSLALVLRGILTHEVLRVALEKRWRVQYGAHPTRSGYDMAVPYKAKDVAQERTEFGHPDVSLALTVLHYYQQGLTEAQLRQVFERLDRLPDGEKKATYRAWAEEVRRSSAVAGLLAGAGSYESVNVDDREMLTRTLYPVLRRHMGVINFWLQRKVFPVQAKQFPSKLVATAGELCLDKATYAVNAVTTGFSGTDDLACLLPMTIQQKNMPQLEMTNGRQLQALIRPENNEFVCLKHSSKTAAVNDTEAILSVLATTEPRINVVLDSGALILELSNVEFVRRWLDTRADMKAAVFFDSSNKVQVLSRHGTTVPLHRSSVADDLSGCLLFLDDIHTRGSDFRLPLHSRGLLTLGRGLARDKLLQTSMRLRQLGQGQSLVFVAQQEVEAELRALGQWGAAEQGGAESDTARVRAILSWATTNTMKRIGDLMPYWAAQGASCMRKRGAIQELRTGAAQRHSVTTEELTRLAETCVADETMSLAEVYGHARESVPLPQLVHRVMQASPSQAGAASGMAAAMQRRAEMWVPRVERPCSMHDEEQERELEAELEEELQVERPGPADPHTPHVSQNLERWARGAEFDAAWFYPAEGMLAETTHTLLREQLQRHGPAGRFLVTEDFAKTIQGESVSKDWFIKRIRWFLSDGQRLVVCSNFEAEALATHLMACAASVERSQPDPTPSTRPQLFPFSPTIRVGQREHYLSGQISQGAGTGGGIAAGYAALMSLHVLGGSIHVPSDVDSSLHLSRLQTALGLKPRPQEDEQAKAWDEAFEEGRIERDGFVKPSSQESELGARAWFTVSPTRALLGWYGTSRHLGAELHSSPVGRMLGAGQLQ